MDESGFRHSLKDKVTRHHARIPGLRKLPLKAVVIILGLGFANAFVWAAIGVVLV